MSGRVTIAGAGCADYDLITLRAVDALRDCDTVIYDSLIDSRVLDFCPNVERICVGKRAGTHSIKQEEINALLVEKALEGKNIVRLKGGDPFVFGRGGEEIMALREHNIPYSVIPGISSCIAVPELSGIPVTHRKTARVFHVITGHIADDLINFERYAALDGTLVFLMGLGNLAEIAQRLIAGGMPGGTPAAVISEGGTFRQRTVRGSLDKIAEAVKREDITAPAVIVVGETAEFDFSAAYNPPLSGISVAVISTRETGKRLCEGLHKLGAYSFRAGGVEIRELFGDKIDRVFSDLAEYGCVAFSSPNGARIFLKKLREKHIDMRSLSGVKIAAIGSGTSGILENAGLFPEFVPEKFTSAELGRLLSNELESSERLLILRSAEGSEELTRPLVQKGIPFDDVRIYAPVYLDGGSVSADYAVFTSAGTVRGFFANGGRISPQTKCAAIGEITAAELKRHGISTPVIPRVSSVEGLIKSILEDIK